MFKLISRAIGLKSFSRTTINNKRGRKLNDKENMLLMYLIQNRFNLSGEGMEEALCASYVMRIFLKINLIYKQVPDATTLL